MSKIELRAKLIDLASHNGEHSYFPDDIDEIMQLFTATLIAELEGVLVEIDKEELTHTNDAVHKCSIMQGHDYCDCGMAERGLERVRIKKAITSVIEGLK
jgi:cytochrome P450